MDFLYKLEGRYYLDIINNYSESNKETYFFILLVAIFN